MTSSLRLLFSRRPDAIYLNSWPLFATALTMLVAKVRRVPVVLSIQDLYPESLAIQGRINTRSLLYRLLLFLDTRIVRSARKAIVISNDFLAPLLKERGVPADSLSVVENWSSQGALECDRERTQAFRRLYNIPDDATLFVYAGNIGAACGAETLVRAFALLPETGAKPYLLFAGEGSHLQSCRDMAKAVRPDRILFHSPWKREETSQVLCAADILLLPTQGRQSLVSMPSKLISYMYAGRPVLASALPNTVTCQLIQESRAGWVVAPDQPEELAEAMQSAISCPSLDRETMGQRAREFAIQHFNRDVSLSRIVNEIRNAGGSRDR